MTFRSISSTVRLRVLAGGSIEKLSKVLGHYSVVMTERYVHLRPDLFADRDLAAIPLDLGVGKAEPATIGVRMGSGAGIPSLAVR